MAKRKRNFKSNNDHHLLIVQSRLEERVDQVVSF